ncbi:MAG: hypothetical protein VYC34_07005, partial [Planctomycetota bacterium]|nr:hypothetical protein [Planctomycetota bacterium]
MANQIAIWTAHFLGVAVIAVTVLPLISTGAWWIRVWDFPRAHLAAIAAAVILALILLRSPEDWRATTISLTSLLALTIIFQSAHVLPYTRLWPRAVPSTDHPHVRLLIINLDKRNHQHARMASTITDSNPDLLLLIEINKDWSRTLDHLRAEYPHRLEDIRPDGLGHALRSRRPPHHT